MRKVKNWLFATSLIFLTACSTTAFKGQSDYSETIESKSAGDKKFAGLYENFEFRATLLTSEILNAIHNRQSLQYQWDQDTQTKERQKLFEKSGTTSRIFMAFFTPNSKNDNLSTSSSIWKIYLHVNGQRYEGKAKKTNLNLSEAIAIYPYHSRWATDYYVDFPVPTADLTVNGIKLEITGPLGNREVTFP